MKKCINCNKEINDSSVFCNFCGTVQINKENKKNTDKNNQPQSQNSAFDLLSEMGYFTDSANHISKNDNTIAPDIKADNNKDFIKDDQEKRFKTEKATNGEHIDEISETKDIVHDISDAEPNDEDQLFEATDSNSINLSLAKDSSETTYDVPDSFYSKDVDFDHSHDDRPKKQKSLYDLSAIPEEADPFVDLNDNAIAAQDIMPKKELSLKNRHVVSEEDESTKKDFDTDKSVSSTDSSNRFIDNDNRYADEKADDIKHGEAQVNINEDDEEDGQDVYAGLEGRKSNNVDKTRKHSKRRREINKKVYNINQDDMDIDPEDMDYDGYYNDVKTDDHDLPKKKSRIFLEIMKYVFIIVAVFLAFIAVIKYLDL